MPLLAHLYVLKPIHFQIHSTTAKIYDNDELKLTKKIVTMCEGLPLQFSKKLFKCNLQFFYQFYIRNEDENGDQLKGPKSLNELQIIINISLMF